jgi:hypothetical protein
LPNLHANGDILNSCKGISRFTLLGAI